jgi:hypothetical protein
MTDGPIELTDEMVTAKWEEIAPLIDVVMKRIQHPNDFAIQAGSQLAVDDIATDPYQLSRCAHWCLNAGVDHLHALKVLLLDAGILHTAAPYSLVRGALENFAAGFWVLHPSERNVRVEHALRWWAKNFKDQNKATEGRGMPNFTPLADKIARLREIAEATNCDLSNLRDGYFSSGALEYTNEHCSVMDPYLIWQLCSGFAHGRPWANLGMNEMESRPTAVEGVVQVRLTTDHTRMLAVTLPAFHLMQDLMRLLQERAQAPD